MIYGFTVQASYTWSHANDDVSNGGIGSTPYNNSQSFGSLTYQINPNCLKCNNYGNADYDIRNSFNASYVWQMPYKFNNAFANAVLGNWILSQNFFARSGLPLSVIDGNTSITNYGPVNTVANVIAGNGQQGCSSGNSQCLNPDCLRSGGPKRNLAEPAPQRVSWSRFLRLGLDDREELQVDGEVRVQLHDQLLQRVQSPEFRQSGPQSRGWNLRAVP